MLEIKSINKSYTTGDFKQQVLNNVSINFRESEFVAILGPSGSGKTTLLNIVGGLDQYDSGDLVINEKSTKKFKQKDWDAYRNNCIGFIFQSYNLITHISILANVEMAMTLSGVSGSVRKQKALAVLDKVGLKEHAHKRPNQLSGGQMQRVAIARALVNDPDIILADEPTGALDTKTSVQIMELIKEIAEDKLVIMVTHNPELAHEYANRIIELKDGNMVNDSNPYQEVKSGSSSFSIKKTAMNYIAALRLSFNNIRTKKGRTLLTSFASSIGIIGIALILALSNGFQQEIDSFERDSLSQMPISISQMSMSLSDETIENMETDDDHLEEHTKEKKVFAADDMAETMMHKNVITEEYVSYIEKLDKQYVGNIVYQKAAAFNTISYNEKNGYQSVDAGEILQSWVVIPSKIDEKSESSGILDNFNIIAGEINDNEPGLVLQVDSKNQLSKSALKQLGFNDDEEVSFDDLLNAEIKVIPNDEFYQAVGNFYLPNSDLETMYNSDNTITLKVQAIMRGKEGKELVTNGSGIGYTGIVTDKVIEMNKDSAVVKAQEASDVSVFSGLAFDEENTKESTLAYLGAESTPVSISIYPKDFDSKDEILDYLSAYNDGKEEADIIEYTDYAAMISSLTGNIMGAITAVLIAFSAISLIVSSIMIAIITYISVLERTKEIGILRALGARKKDITRVFNAETLIIGLCSGLLGIGIAQLLTIPANIVIEDVSGLANVAKLDPIHALILVVISVALTLLGGFIPAKMAAKKDPVEALRSE
ncbi:MAG: ATP-binding cassette domain-containing protein [Coprobacillaceae bacterium]